MEKAKTFKQRFKRMKYLIIAAFVLITIVALLSSCTNYSTGERTGVITKFSKSGKAFKSWEGELKIAPNIAHGGGMVGQYETFSFSIDNDGTIECKTHTDSILHWARLGKPVTIMYQQTKYLNWWSNRGMTNYFTKEVIPVNN